MKSNLLYLISVLIFNSVLLQQANGQTGYTFNYNFDNGLPSNHIYGVITDSHGYLWIATDKGVVKYNGYEFKVFGVTDGLPTDDVWQLIEDKKGRIWLGNNTDEMGYLYNDKYHKAYLKGGTGTIYPMDMRAYADGVLFYSNYINENIIKTNKLPAFCLNQDDTILVHNISKTIFNKFPFLNHYSVENNYEATNRIYVAITYKGKNFLIYRGTIFQVWPNESFDSIKLISKINDYFFINYISNKSYISIGDYFITYYAENNEFVFYCLNLVNGKTQIVNLGKYTKTENIEAITPDQNARLFYVVTNKHINEFEYENGIKYIRKFSIDSSVNIPDINGKNITTIQNNGHWGNILGSISKGIFLLHNETNNFIPYQFPDLKNFSFLGCLQDSVIFWWNSSLSMLYGIEKNNIRKIKINNVGRITNIMGYDKDTFLINGFSNYFLIYSKGEIVKIHPLVLGKSTYSTIINGPGNYTVLSSAGIHNKIIVLNKIETNNINMDKYNYMIYDSFRKDIIAYNYNKIFIHGKRFDSSITKDRFLYFGVKKIEKIDIDNTYGNMFFKGTDKITVYDAERNVHIELLKNINLKDASIHIYHQILIVAGKFGVAFCNITGKLQISEPEIYYNLKNENYNIVNSCQASWGKLLMNTDKGLFQVTIPSDSEITHSVPDSLLFAAKFIYKYRDTINNFKSGDTVILNQLECRIQFDVINPFGSGIIKYVYQYDNDTIWHELNANELNIPNNFAPDNYYTLSLKAYDNIWKSDPVYLHFYIHPYWYQTKIGKRVIWVSMIVLIILILTSAVLITREFVLSAAKKRTQRLELELKAIYAQINPHFIFNTLNSALSMAKKNKMDEVYNHISKFSSLLRGYIKSARNKLTTIAEETENLRDYIDLQQTRFKNKFEYEIITDAAINPETTRIPSLLIQPFVENAITHGILPMEENGHLKIEFLSGKKENELICTIEDNGIGRKKSKSLNEINNQKGESYGDLLIKDLVAIFNKYEQMNIEIAYTDKEPPLSGTIVTIKIKNPQNA